MIKSCILAIDAGGTYLKSALFLEDGMIQENSFVKVPVNSAGTLTEIKDSYQGLVKKALKIAFKEKLDIKSIGICIPGPFDYMEGVCRMKHKYAAIYGIPIGPWLNELIGFIPITFIHDSEAFLKGAIYQSGLNFKKVCGVTIGTGLGFAIAENNIIQRNSSGGPKISIYHMLYQESVAEDYVSKRGIINRYQELRSEEIEIEVYNIANAARSGETIAIQVFQEMGVHLAAILHDIIEQNEMECLFLSGAISKSAELFLPQLREGLIDIPSLKLIQKVEDIDNAPLYGIFSREVR